MSIFNRDGTLGQSNYLLEDEHWLEYAEFMLRHPERYVKSDTPVNEAFLMGISLGYQKGTTNRAANKRWRKLVKSRKSTR